MEELLGNKDVSDLSDEHQKKRKMALQFLHQYWTAGVFPINYDYAERRPCFIDREGNICAVGYLVAKTAGIDHDPACRPPTHTRLAPDALASRFGRVWPPGTRTPLAHSALPNP